MNVIVLTVFIGLDLVFFFILMFLHVSSDPRSASSERDALLPLQEDKTASANHPSAPSFKNHS